MDPNGSLESPPTAVRQRWRIVYRRLAAAAGLSQRALEGAWLAALETSSLPLAPTGPASRRWKVVFGPPLPLGALGERELLDVYLRERVSLADLRARLGPVVPAGFELVDAYDVWVGAPALPAVVAAVDYRIELPVGPDEAAPVLEGLRTAIQRLLAAETLPRSRARGNRTRDYDLRPFLVALGVAPSDEGAVRLEMRLRVDPAAGSGRPDEVLRALLDAGDDGEALAVVRSLAGSWLERPGLDVLRAERRPDAEASDAPASGEAGRELEAPGSPSRPELPTTAPPLDRLPGRVGLPAVAQGGSAGSPAPSIVVVRERLVTADELVGEAGPGIPPTSPGEPDPLPADPATPTTELGSGSGGFPPST